MQAKIVSKGPGSVNPGPLAPPPKPKDDGGMTMMAPAAGAGPVAPPPPEKKPKVLVGKVVSKPAAQAPEEAAPPPEDAPVADTVDAEPPRPVTKVVAPVAGPKGTKVLTKKKASTPLPPSEEAPAEGKPKVLKAKIVSPGATGARSAKKLQGHMKTVVMDTKEFEEMPADMIEPPAEGADAEKKPKKRVTKFKVKGPK